MKMTSRYTTFRSPQQPPGVPTTNLKNMTQTQPNPNDDDEFSDFKSGLPVSSPAPATSGSRSTHVPLLSSNLLQYTSSPTHYVPPANRRSTAAAAAAASAVIPDEVGSRLANYTLGLANTTGQERPDSCLMGDEDKYSPLRAFLQNEFQATQESQQMTNLEKTKTIDEDGDFGDFQGFTQWTPKEEHLTVVPIPIQNIPIPTMIPITQASTVSVSKPVLAPVSNHVTPTFNVAPLQTSRSESQSSSTFDDFGDFVSFSGKSSVTQFAPPHTSALKTEKSTPSIDLFSLGISLTNKSKNAVAPPSVSSSRSDSLLPELDADMDMSTSASRPFHLDGLAPLKTTLISGPSPTDLDPFGDFLASPTVTRRSEVTDQQIQSSKKDTPETMSVSSLDLGNYGGSSWELPETVGNKALGNTPKEVQRTSPLLNNEDKYSAFKEEQDRETEKCFTDWRRMLEKCLKLIEEGERVFQSVSSSDILRQVIHTEKGRNYVLGLRQVYLVSCRVYQSWMRLGGNEVVSELHQKLALAWDSIAPFLLGTNLEEDFRRRSPMSDEDAENVCGICLIGTGWRDGEEEESWRLSLDFGGTLYHLPCANLWINQVDSMLPTLGASKNITTKHYQTLI